MACGSTRDLSAHFAVLVLALHTASAALQLDAGGPAAGPAPGMAGAGAGAALDTPLPPGAALAGRFADFPTLWQYYEALYPSAQLVPSVTSFRGMDQWHEVLFQAPPAPRALLFIAHGCSHAARDWWPPSHACPHCLGLPEEVAQTQQALARGYAGAGRLCRGRALLLTCCRLCPAAACPAACTLGC